MKTSIIIALLVFSTVIGHAQQLKKNNSQQLKATPKTDTAGIKKLNSMDVTATPNTPKQDNMPVAKPKTKDDMPMKRIDTTGAK